MVHKAFSSTRNRSSELRAVIGARALLVMHAERLPNWDSPVLKAKIML
jgi:hypothetical protein